MKKTLTLKEIQSIHHDSLAKILLSMANSDDVVYKKMEKLLLSQNPKELYKSIMKDISSIKRGRKFISYGDSFNFSKRVQGIVEDIASLVSDDQTASKLLKELILTDSKVYLRSDDSAGAIQLSYALAEDDWKVRTLGVDDSVLLVDLEEMLLCDGFGMRDIFSEQFSESVYKVLYDKVMLSYTVSDEEFEKSSFHHVLLSIAQYLCSPRLYIQTKALDTRPFSGHDYFDIAKQYQHIEDAENTLVYLDKIEKDWYKKEDMFKIRVWAYEMLKDATNVTKVYKAWYEEIKSPQTYRRYTERLQGEEKEMLVTAVLKDIEILPFQEAITFYHALDEKELCATYVMSYHDKMEMIYMQQKFLKTFLAWLSDGYPQEAILFYRDVCEKALSTSQSKYYGGAIWTLKEMLKLEQMYHDMEWKVEDNSSYLENLLEKHKQKRKFIELFDTAF